LSPTLRLKVGVVASVKKWWPEVLASGVAAKRVLPIWSCGVMARRSGSVLRLEVEMAAWQDTFQSVATAPSGVGTAVTFVVDGHV